MPKASSINGVTERTGRPRPDGESLPRAMSPVRRDMVRVHTNHIALQERDGARCNMPKASSINGLTLRRREPVALAPTGRGMG